MTISTRKRDLATVSRKHYTENLVDSILDGRTLNAQKQVVETTTS